MVLYNIRYFHDKITVNMKPITVESVIFRVEIELWCINKCQFFLQYVAGLSILNVKGCIPATKKRIINCPLIKWTARKMNWDDP